MEELLTAKDLARVLGVRVEAIYQRRLRKASLPPGIKLGNLHRFRRVDVENWLTTHTQKSN
ncbi:helix-turn-helix transcriptional regulator [Denitratisoma oestradiolicum]|uniref:Helix-turn-helix domain-containing protein n=1 Tax=Denitratisoma oestradiolicum TaxID=311182 RepID=A0A6S6Y676_9PROT|nr:helix-turn-helix domain-containing protein [Denitratisoma oestradiolicum]TWO80692.1 hypothetical protein CBW56_07950 [Denitratisoma oestradiolicum]CAB1371010.1 conserved protein of unknown function [Denitratisoma oestradiolicum]